MSQVSCLGAREATGKPHGALKPLSSGRSVKCDISHRHDDRGGTLPAPRSCQVPTAFITLSLSRQSNKLGGRGGLGVGVG